MQFKDKQGLIGKYLDGEKAPSVLNFSTRARRESHCSHEDLLESQATADLEQLILENMLLDLNHTA